jgi:hypothetical protein
MPAARRRPLAVRLGEGLRELSRFLRTHEPCRVLAHAVAERRDVLARDGVRVHAERVQLAGQELLCRGAEVALRDAEQLLRKGVQSSPPAGSSESA